VPEEDRDRDREGVADVLVADGVREGDRVGVTVLERVLDGVRDVLGVLDGATGAMGEVDGVGDGEALVGVTPP
jgi:hypothetical protein